MDFIIFLKKIASRMPGQRLLQRIWHLWSQSVKWDKGLVDSISGYFKVSQKEVRILLRAGEDANDILWNSLKSVGKEDVFYNLTPFYIFDLAFWHMTRYQRAFRSKIIKLAKGKVLDFGGGIGDLSISLFKKGLSVTYADVKGETFKFAEYLFSKNSASIKMIDLSKNKIKEGYDTIVCLDVIEHLENQKETLSDLAGHLNPGGFLIINNLDFKKPDKNHLMHIPVRFGARKYLLRLGLKPTNYPWLFIKK